LAVALVCTPAAGADNASASSEVIERQELETEPGQANAIKELKQNDEQLKERTTWVIYPIGVLLAVLTLGGGLSVVFSIREQRRATQLHELSVVGEVSSQRRAEQSYGSFLEQSHTTIALVNDTLLLAKEASAREARSGRSKAEERVGAIEALSEALMLQVFREEDFELLLDDRDHRRDLHRIGQQLRELETSLNVQDIKLPPYTTFVKAVDQFLLDDTESAIHALRRASQDDQISDLHRFTLYWLGYMLTTVGEYQEAITRFRDDEIGLPKDDAERVQLERMVIETEFFRSAKPTEQQDEPAVDARGPHERFAAVADLLDRLASLAVDIDNTTHSVAKTHTRQEVAQTRADIYAWIAYDPSRLDEPIKGEDAYRSAGKVPMLDTPGESLAQETQERQPKGPARVFADSDAFTELGDGDAFRVWALKQARAICEREQEKAALNFYVAFAMAECSFMLAMNEQAELEFAAAERRLDREFGEDLEKRKLATLHESLLICHSRELALHVKEEGERSRESKVIRQASRDAQAAVQGMGQPNVTVFSQIQRRNISQAEFRDEIEEIVDQEGDRLD
jgi:hypothetical protein